MGAGQETLTTLHEAADELMAVVKRYFN
jgi:hypothetical protein